MHRMILIPLCFWLAACSGEPAPKQLTEQEKEEIVKENLSYRRNREEFFRESPHSPFQRDTTVEYTRINWYPVDPLYRGYSVLHRYEDPVDVEICGTGGEIRKQTRYGYFEIVVPDSVGDRRTIRLNAYKVTPDDPLQYARFKDALSVWFTDETTGFETYGVGRYIEVGTQNPDPDHLYLIDLNMAYNPFCAYSDLYSCAIPSEEDHIPVPIRAGEKNYHAD